MIFPPDAALPPVHVIESEYERLTDVICASPVETEALALLCREMLRAEIIGRHEAPADLVRLGACVRYTDLFAGRTRTVELLGPEHAALAPGQVAAVTTLGAALIGLRPGATFSWLSSEGLRAIRIDAVAYSREAGQPS